MNHVPDKWLKRLRWAFVAYSLHFVAAYVYWAFFKGAAAAADNPFAIGLVALVGLQLLYEVYASVSLVKRRPWVAALLSYIFVVIESFIILETTGVYTSPYIFALMGFGFVGMALGLYVSPSLVIIMLVGFLLGVSGFFTNNEGGTKGGLLALAGVAGASVAGYLFWRRFYSQTSNQEVDRLTTLLKTRQSQTEILLQSVADGVIVTDTKGNITLINPAAAKLSGWSAEEATGINVNQVLKLSYEDTKPLQGEDKAIFEAVLSKKQSVNKTLQLTPKSATGTAAAPASKLIISLVVSPILVPPSNETVGAVAVLRDISKEREQENQRAEFISTASHEMRTPVAAIEGYLALALNPKVSNIDTKARSYLDKAHASTQHLGKLFQDLLTSAKAEDGRLASHPQVVELGALLEQVTDSLKFAADKKGLQTEFILGTTETGSHAVAGGKTIQPLYYVFVDADRIREVITNLFDNAIKYTDKGRITIGLTGNQQVVQMYVQDTGPGIPTEDIPHLFQKFYRVDSSATRTVGGTGLGLFICRKIVELYRGRIWVESEVGKGSTFYINLPRLTTEKADQLQSGVASTNTGTPTVVQ